MLDYELTPKHAGIIIWGDPWSLSRLRETIYHISENSPYITYEDGFELGLAYDVRKACEGQRLSSTRKLDDATCTVYGVEILWPEFIAQVAVLRAALAHMTSNSEYQAVLYELENILEKATKAADSNSADEILMHYSRIKGYSYEHLDVIIDSRAAYFVSLPESQRYENLAMVLESLDPFYDNPEAINWSEYTDIEWPDFEW